MNFETFIENFSAFHRNVTKRIFVRDAPKYIGSAKSIIVCLKVFYLKQLKASKVSLIYIFYLFFQIIIFSALLAVAFAAPQVNPADAQAQVVKYDSDNTGIDGYNFA